MVLLYNLLMRICYVGYCNRGNRDRQSSGTINTRLLRCLSFWLCFRHFRTEVYSYHLFSWIWWCFWNLQLSCTWFNISWWMGWHAWYKWRPSVQIFCCIIFNFVLLLLLLVILLIVMLRCSIWLCFHEWLFFCWLGVWWRGSKGMISTNRLRREGREVGRRVRMRIRKLRGRRVRKGRRRVRKREMMRIQIEITKIPIWTKIARIGFQSRFQSRFKVGHSIT